MSHTFSDPDLAELDRIWPLGRRLVVPDEGCIVIVGAYEGRYMRYLRELYPNAYLFGYEPQPAKFDMLKCRWRKGARNDVFNCALGTAVRQTPIGRSGCDGASLISTDNPLVEVRTIDAVTELSAYRNIDLLLMNCEGSEWALLPYLLDEMMHHRIRSMAIQFHPKYVSIERCNRVVSYLLEYYTQEYQDWPNWNYYVRKEPPYNVVAG